MYLQIIFKTIIGLFIFSTSSFAQDIPPQEIKDKILSSAIRIDYINSSGLGFYLGDGRILTAAHVVMGLHFPKSVPLQLVSSSGENIYLPKESFQIKIDPQTETTPSINQFGYTQLALKNDVAILQITDKQIVKKLDQQFSPISESMKSSLPVQIGDVFLSVGNQRAGENSVFEVLQSEVVMLRDNEILLLPKQNRSFLPGDSGGATFRLQNGILEIVGINAQVYGLYDKSDPLVVNSVKTIPWESTSGFANPLEAKWDQMSIPPGPNFIMQMSDQTLIELSRIFTKISPGQSALIGSQFFKPILETYFMWSMPENMLDDMVRVFRISLPRTLDPTRPNLEYLRSRMLQVTEKYRGYGRGQCIHLFWRKRSFFEINSGVI